MGANCNTSEKKISGMFQIGIQLKIPKNLESISLFLFAVLETDEMPNSCNGTIKEALR